MTPSLDVFYKLDDPGIVHLEYVLLDDVNPDSLAAIVARGWSRGYEVELLEGEWQVLPTIPTPSWGESTNRTDQGVAFSEEVRAKTPQLHRAATAVFDQLSRLRLLLRVTDAEGRKWVVGNDEQGFSLAYQRNAGGAGPMAGYNITLTGQMSHSVAQLVPF